MTDDIPPNLALLPAGLRDLLPPEAETEAASVSASGGSRSRRPAGSRAGLGGGSSVIAASVAGAAV